VGRRGDLLLGYAIEFGEALLALDEGTLVLAGLGELAVALCGLQLQLVDRFLMGHVRASRIVVGDGRRREENRVGDLSTVMPFPAPAKLPGMSNFVEVELLQNYPEKTLHPGKAGTFPC